VRKDQNMVIGNTLNAFKRFTTFLLFLKITLGFTGLLVKCGR